jgi:hypothetical protein
MGCDEGLVRLKFTNISEDIIAFIFKTEEYGKKATREINTFFRNVG